MHKEYSSLGEHIVIKRSKRAKRLALRLDNKARVFNLVIPHRMSLRSTGARKRCAAARDPEAWHPGRQTQGSKFPRKILLRGGA